MITDAQLYKLALFLGCAAMLMIVFYHFLEVNAKDEEEAEAEGDVAAAVKVETKGGVRVE